MEHITRPKISKIARRSLEIPTISCEGVEVSLYFSNQCISVLAALWASYLAVFFSLYLVRRKCVY